MIERDCYQVLGVARGASQKDIRAAYVRLAKRHHPDLAAPADTLPNRLQEVQHAYRILSGAESKAAHDRRLEARDNAHDDRQRRVYRRIRRYDWRHPRTPTWRYRQPGWRTLLMVGIGMGLVARLSMALAG